MSMPKVEYRWTVGNLLTLGAMCIQLAALGGGGLWYASKLENRVELSVSNQANFSNSTTTEIQQIRRDVQGNTNRLQAVELNYGRMDERLISMQSLLQNIDRRLERFTGGN